MQSLKICLIMSKLNLLVLVRNYNNSNYKHNKLKKDYLNKMNNHHNSKFLHQLRIQKHRFNLKEILAIVKIVI